MKRSFDTHCEIFVEDGDLKPTMYQDQSQDAIIDILHAMKALVKAFGFYWHSVSFYCVFTVSRLIYRSVKSPSLATSELGEMSRLKLVHAIITNDFRVFVFGAEKLIERCVLSEGLVNL